MQEFAMSESGGRRSETHFERRRLDQVVSRKGLDEACLTVAACAENDALCRCRSASSDYQVDRSLLARVFARRSPGLHRAGHFCEPLFLFGLGQRANLVFVMFFGCQHVSHEPAVENSADGFHVRDLGMVLEPERMRKSAPGQSKLCFD